MSLLLLLYLLYFLSEILAVSHLRRRRFVDAGGRGYQVAGSLVATAKSTNRKVRSAERALKRQSIWRHKLLRFHLTLTAAAKQYLCESVFRQRDTCFCWRIVLFLSLTVFCEQFITLRNLKFVKLLFVFVCFVVFTALLPLHYLRSSFNFVVGTARVARCRVSFADCRLHS